MVENITLDSWFERADADTSGPAARSLGVKPSEVCCSNLQVDARALLFKTIFNQSHNVWPVHCRPTTHVLGADKWFYWSVWPYPNLQINLVSDFEDALKLDKEEDLIWSKSL